MSKSWLLIFLGSLFIGVGLGIISRDAHDTELRKLIREECVDVR